jgi:rare lipoprotein A
MPKEKPLMPINRPIEKAEHRNSKVSNNIEIGKRTEKSFSQVLKNEKKIETAMVAKANDQSIEYIVRPGDHLSKIGKAFDTDPRKIATENGLINPDLIYPGQKLWIPSSPTGKGQPRLREDVVASWYGEEHHQKTTASGQPFDMNKNTLAHRTLPFGTRVRLTNPENGKTAEGVINDRGPLRQRRDIDVSYALAKELGFVRKGVTRLEIEII